MKFCLLWFRHHQVRTSLSLLSNWSVDSHLTSQSPPARPRPHGSISEWSSQSGPQLLSCSWSSPDCRWGWWQSRLSQNDLCDQSGGGRSRSPDDDWQRPTECHSWSPPWLGQCQYLENMGKEECYTIISKSLKMNQNIHWYSVPYREPWRLWWRGLYPGHCGTASGHQAFAQWSTLPRGVQHCVRHSPILLPTSWQYGESV